MSTAHWKGPVLPDIGDDLIAAWRTYTDTAGVIGPVSDPATARVILSSAEAAGDAPTPTSPSFFLIGGIVYYSTGAKSTDGVWRLSPINEIERDRREYDEGGMVTLAQNQADYIITSELGVQGYDRVVLAFGQAWGSVTAGRVNLVVQIAGVQGQRAAFDTDGGESQSSMNMLEVPAGTAPAVRLALLGGTGGGTIQKSTNPLTTRLSVVAFPITMA